VSTQVSDRPDRHRYEILLDGRLAGFAAYRAVSPELLAFTHTEIEPEFEHRGLGTTLVADALDDAKRRGLKVLPECPFVRSYLADHPNVHIVPEDERPRFGL
jgi:predicted GNAT family acetyltransferase